MTIVIFLGIVNAFGGGTGLIGPKVQADLGFSTDELQWLSTSFYIPLVRRTGTALLLYFLPNLSFADDSFGLITGLLLAHER